jgi:hypothetical protein
MIYFTLFNLLNNLLFLYFARCDSSMINYQSLNINIYLMNHQIINFLNLVPYIYNIIVS